MSQGITLILDQVSHAWGRLQVLDSVTLTAKPGEVMVLIGPSGCRPPARSEPRAKSPATASTR
jgi:ABC-type transporter Mla maintaining outer membrane lipid asymmetry ATPase subunit MlaF